MPFADNLGDGQHTDVTGRGRHRGGLRPRDHIRAHIETKDVVVMILVSRMSLRMRQLGGRLIIIQVVMEHDILMPIMLDQNGHMSAVQRRKQHCQRHL